ncbi:hypothetical protein AFLA_006018 [Aspergillus flavus NRRL3357]|nr:hypothetical protein AFLA_006018 [Aspergillus flavus NRRL3357]
MPGGLQVSTLTAMIQVNTEPILKKCAGIRDCSGTTFNSPRLDDIFVFNLIQEFCINRCISGNSVIMADSRKCQSHACADIWADVARLVCTARATEIEGQMIQE